ncbi:MAG: 3-hydroxyacyl-CoA dehydrogenase NAD-binding domain-containing protein [Pseudomonadota bacterium]
MSNAPNATSSPVVTLSFEHDPAFALVAIDNPPVNGISQGVREGLRWALERATQAPAARAVLIVCAGENFLSGQDIREFGRPVAAPSLRELFSRMESLALPIVVAAHGVALGGGLELLLCADHRVVAQDTLLGFPEINYGLVPGAGGTQRLPRLIGARAALELMGSGKRITATRALELGLVDAVYERPRSPASAALEAAQALLKQQTSRRRVSARTVALNTADDSFDREAAKLLARSRGYRTPGRLVSCVRAASAATFEDGLAVESAEHGACSEDPQHLAMLHMFFSERRARQLPSSAQGAADPVDHIAVVGAGTMGLGIALACLHAGLAVTLHDQSRQASQRARQQVDRLLSRDVERGRLSAAQANARAARLEVTDQLDPLGQAQVIIEAVFEDLALKQRLFCTLDAALPKAALFASNTSTLDVESIARATTRPERVIGLHFFSPAHLMPLVEVVVGDWNRKEAEHLGRDLTRRLNKVGVVVGNGFGFVGNRMLYAYGRENQLMLLEGASPQRIDQVLEDFGFAMGPNAVGDLAGLDVGYRARRAWAERPDDPRFYRVADALVEAERLGQKSGAGCYRYETGSRKAIPDPATDALIRHEADLLGVVQREHGDTEILERCLFALAVEGSRLLESGVAGSAADIDVIWCNGYGFPRHRGGPMHHAEHCGLGRVVEAAERYGALTDQSHQWRVPALLRAAAEGAGRFAER